MRALTLLVLFGCRTDAPMADAQPLETVDTVSPGVLDIALQGPSPVGSASPTSRSDLDGDGVFDEDDCDDTDPLVGTLLFKDDLSADSGALSTPPEIDGDWVWDGDSVYATDGGQRALPGQAQAWGDVVVYGTLAALGTRVGCGFECEDACGDVVPDDCYTEWEALGLGILTAQADTFGVLTYSNSGDYDVCLEAGASWDAPSSQGTFVGEWNSDDEYRVPAGGSLDVHYGTWTTDNGVDARYLGEPDFWCFQHGTTFATGVVYGSIGAYVPDGMFGIARDEADSDGDGVEDHVDWVDATGVLTQHDVWDFQDTHAAVVVGKLAGGGAEALTETLTVRNRGVLPADAVVTDTVPALWSLVDCDLAPDTEVLADDGAIELSWRLALDGCTSDCSVVDEQVITCTLAHNLNVDVDMVELPAARVDYDDGDAPATSWSMPATAFDYDHNGDGDITCGETDRWRAGVLGRAALDDDQDEGFHGYRCALARNSVEDCYADGHFLQIAEFMDAPEDDVDTECTDDCPNPTFDQLARVDHDGAIDLSAGDGASLAFWLVGEDLYCLAAGDDGTTVAASATDDSFAGGTTGLSTLNMFGDFDHIRVCEAFGLPE